VEYQGEAKGVGDFGSVLQGVSLDSN